MLMGAVFAVRIPVRLADILLLRARVLKRHSIMSQALWAAVLRLCGGSHLRWALRPGGGATEHFLFGVRPSGGSRVPVRDGMVQDATSIIYIEQDNP